MSSEVLRPGATLPARVAFLASNLNRLEATIFSEWPKEGENFLLINEGTLPMNWVEIKVREFIPDLMSPAVIDEAGDRWSLDEVVRSETIKGFFENPCTVEVKQRGEINSYVISDATTVLYLPLSNQYESLFSKSLRDSLKLDGRESFRVFDAPEDWRERWRLLEGKTFPSIIAAKAAIRRLFAPLTRRGGELIMIPGPMHLALERIPDAFENAWNPWFVEGLISLCELRNLWGTLWSKDPEEDRRRAEKVLKTLQERYRSPETSSSEKLEEIVLEAVDAPNITLKTRGKKKKKKPAE